MNNKDEHLIHMLCNTLLHHLNFVHSYDTKLVDLNVV
jgi:hypothetical protein